MGMDPTPRPSTKDRYRISWTPHGATKRVEITQVESGRTFVGSDWASWDTAYQEALQQAVTRRVS
jgi:hypothetical protein